LHLSQRKKAPKAAQDAALAAVNAALESFPKMGRKQTAVEHIRTAWLFGSGMTPPQKAFPTLPLL
jgi:hypothetical protein